MAPTATSSENGSKRGPLTDMQIRAKVLEPFTYVCGLPGKGIREKFTRCFNKWFENSEEDVNKAIEYFDKVHNASLVIDDIEDGSDLRRGSPAAHMKYGIPLSINAGYCAVYVLQREAMNSEHANLEYMKQAFDGIIRCHEGQGMEIYWRDILTAENILEEGPTIRDYEDVICNKTGVMFIGCLQSGQHFSPKQEVKKYDLTNFGKNFGIYFQIRDDLFNICDDKYAENKGFAEDVTEGKLSYMVIHCLNNESVPTEKKLRLFEILKMRTNSQELKKEAVAILKDSGALDAARKRLSELHTMIFEEIEKMEFAENEVLEEFFNDNLWIGN